MLAVAVGCRERSTSEIPEEGELACARCTLDRPPNAGSLPLVVVLHGDDDTATERVAVWREPALARGWAVLGLQCPAELGCPGASWYAWEDGSPSWVLEQIARVRDLDRDRVYLVGWSGGATFMGMNAAAWSRDIAALVFHGGGQPPRDEECGGRLPPAYFLVGDQNPHHAGTQRLRAHFERCNAAIEWDLREGANHAAELAALDERKVSAILDWLAERARE